MKRYPLLPLAAALAACASAPVTYEQAEAAAARAKAEYCALRPEAREALRARLTGGVAVVDCPGDRYDVSSPARP